MNQLKTLIREIEDYPKPGIRFYDITTLLKHPSGFRAVIDALRAHGELGAAGHLDAVIAAVNCAPSCANEKPAPVILPRSSFTPVAVKPLASFQRT